jgi:hypothetical protein
MVNIYIQNCHIILGPTIFSLTRLLDHFFFQSHREKSECRACVSIVGSVLHLVGSTLRCSPESKCTERRDGEQAALDKPGDQEIQDGEEAILTIELVRLLERRFG